MRGLLLWRVTGGQHAAEKLSQKYYGTFIEDRGEGRHGGRMRVRALRRLHQGEAAQPRAPDAHATKEFINTMTMWRKRFLQYADLPIVGATEARSAVARRSRSA